MRSRLAAAPLLRPSLGRTRIGLHALAAAAAACCGLLLLLLLLRLTPSLPVLCAVCCAGDGHSGGLRFEI